MSVREALLALLVDGPKHGYQLKSEFDEATGATWTLNVGQVYTTLQRLERDNLVSQGGTTDEEGRISYLLTEAGRSEVDDWLGTPSGTPIASRDETSMRVLLSLATGAAPVKPILASQRDAAMETLQTLTAMKGEPPKPGGSEVGDLAWRLQLDRMIFLAEAEIRWLDLTETRLAERGGGPKSEADAPVSDDRSPAGPSRSETTRSTRTPS